jgi:cytidine deaminase
MDLARLVTMAEEARSCAHAPYSNFFVGAALLTDSGRIFTGCNVENATYGATICAERAAVCAMVATGERRIRAIAVFTDAAVPATPCGICRQVLAEFADDAVVVVATPRQQKTLSLAALLPERFVLLGETT